MPEYRLYHFERAQIRRSDTLTAKDDYEAEMSARPKVQGGKAELWRGARMLKVFAPRA